MKVLFAVNSESISDAIIKKYQKDYREILSYKNVYYFNAIQKEIQKDKSYDRIVISEDLEPFSNNNYESIDKFIFEKLDGISDEAHDTEGNEMSIILICSDRHTKGSSFLVKLFGISVYNALLGNDRSMEEVCRLINKPRNKKEAKMYYKIDTDDVNYRAENENEVSELEIQNIIAHFKKLGKNSEKYANSFENIANQYTDEQLKIIINCLPINVKAILEETSSKYQEIMSVTGGLVKGVRSTNAATRQDQKRTGLKIDIIENKMSQNKMNGPIVIPNSVKSARSVTAKKVTAIGQNPQTSKMVKSQTAQAVQKNKMDVEEQLISKKRIETTKKVEKPKQAFNDEDLLLKKDHTVVDKKMANLSQTKTVKPVRKSSMTLENVEKEMDLLEDIELPDLEVNNGAMNYSNTLNNNHLMNEKNEGVQPVKRGRGRPRKNPIDVMPKPKGKRGRPRKNPVPEPILEENDEDLDTILDTNNQLELNSYEPKQPELTEVEKDEFEDVLGLEDNILDENIINEESDLSEEIELPELDELEDMSDFDNEIDDDLFSDITEESFDEFDDYDEYGEYETQTQINSEEEENIDELYEQDILVDANLELPELEEESAEEELLPDFDTENALDELSISDDVDDDLLIADDVENDDDLLSDFETDELEETDDVNLLSDLEEDDSEELLSAFDETENDLIENTELEENDFIAEDSSYENNESDFAYGEESLQSIESPIDYSMSNLNSLMTKDKKIVTFLGSTKNGVSFLVNNLAEIFASVGIDTAILDMTKNKNSYYIYTQNEETLRKIAYTSIENLQNGVAEGIKVKNNLTVYTALPNDGKDYSNAEPILSTLVQNHSLVLIDCDFDTNPSYFASCQEIYLIQSMDILTIQPLTAFLRDLKTQGVLEPEKVRVVINKELKVRGLTNKAIIGGMAFYNDPAMSFMTELFNKDTVKYCSIPFEEMVYSKYLEAMLNCKISINGYSKNFMSKLRILGDMVYPLTSRQTYSSKVAPDYSASNFSNRMNDTLNKMKKKY